MILTKRTYQMESRIELIEIFFQGISFKLNAKSKKIFDYKEESRSKWNRERLETKSFLQKLIQNGGRSQIKLKKLLRFSLQEYSLAKLITRFLRVIFFVVIFVNVDWVVDYVVDVLRRFCGNVDGIVDCFVDYIYPLFHGVILGGRCLFYYSFCFTDFSLVKNEKRTCDDVTLFELFFKINLSKTVKNAILGGDFHEI